MKLLIKQSNFIIFAIVLALYIVLKPYQYFSFDLSSIVDSKTNEKYQLFSQFNYSKSLIVATKGFDNQSITKLQKIEKDLTKESLISKVFDINSKEYQEYQQRYRFYLNDLKKEIDIKREIDAIFTNMTTSLYYTVDKQDPLNIVKQKNSNTTIYPKLKNYGYFTILKIDANTNQQKIDAYNKINQILTDIEDIRYFSSIFYYVENSKKIKDDVKMIITISTIVLLILYIYLIKNIYLFINAITTLVTSVLLAQIIIVYLFSSISILAIALCSAITSISIDYLFHHYLHRYYSSDFRFNKDVFFGFISTILSLFVLSFIDMMLLRQIAYLCIFSLSIAYIHFAFIYPYLGIKYKDNYKKLYIKPIASISHKKLLLLFSILLVVGITNSKYDFDIKNLDYQNHKLKSDESFFRQRLNQNNTVATIISDTSIEALIKKTKKIKDIDSSSLCTLSSLMTNNEYTNRQSLIKSYDFEKIKDELIEYSIQKGFKKEYFNSSYTYELLYPTKIEYTLQILQALNVEVIKKETKYYSYIIVSRDKLPTLIEQNLVEDIRANKFFELSLKKAYNDLVIYGIITIIIILTILYIALKKEIRKALLFLVAPLCMIFLYSLFGKLNIIHLFMIFVILAISIDYGIYINSKNNSKESNVSIFYSLISTFAGFGVLVISSVSSIFSIGIASVLGIFALIVLLSINIL